MASKLADGGLEIIEIALASGAAALTGYVATHQNPITHRFLHPPGPIQPMLRHQRHPHPPAPGLDRPWRGGPGRRLRGLYRTLYAHYGPRHWWPGESAFEILVGVVLTQNTNWTNVEKAIGNLSRARLLDARRLLNAPPARIAEHIRPSGYFNVKTRRLLSVAAWLAERYGGSFEAMAGVAPAALRHELLGVHGLGPESADSILLYALNRPSFVIDAYTRRILHRHGLCDARAPYAELKALFEDHLPADAALFNEYHALIVYAGKDFCKPAPRCAQCPLRRSRPSRSPGAGPAP